MKKKIRFPRKLKKAAKSCLIVINQNTYLRDYKYIGRFTKYKSKAIRDAYRHEIHLYNTYLEVSEEVLQELINNMSKTTKATKELLSALPNWGNQSSESGMETFIGFESPYPRNSDSINFKELEPIKSSEIKGSPLELYTTE